MVVLTIAVLLPPALHILLEILPDHLPLEELLRFCLFAAAFSAAVYAAYRIASHRMPDCKALRDIRQSPNE